MRATSCVFLTHAYIAISSVNYIVRYNGYVRIGYFSSSRVISIGRSCRITKYLLDYHFLSTIIRVYGTIVISDGKHYPLSSLYLPLWRDTEPL